MITQQRPYILEGKTQAFVDALSAQGGSQSTRSVSARLACGCGSPNLTI